MSKKQDFLNRVSDGVSNIFYYDRKNDDELSYSEVDEMVASGEITLKEVLSTFEAAIIEHYPEITRE